MFVVYIHNDKVWYFLSYPAFKLQEKKNDKLKSRLTEVR